MTQKQSMQLLTSMKTAKWYTPPWYLELVRLVFEGEIDLDPASDPNANQFVRANRYYTPRKNDGLLEPWVAKNIFLNPPYSVEGLRVAATSHWVSKAAREYHQGNYPLGIMLLNAKVGYKWFNRLLDSQYTLSLLHRNRIGFIDAETLLESKPSRQPQATIYIGDNQDLFREIFGKLGWLI